MRGVDVRWYDGFFLSMLVTSVIVVGINWNKYEACRDPLHIWTVVDYSMVFIARILMFMDNFFVATLVGLMAEERRQVAMAEDLGGMAEYHRAMTEAHRHRFYVYRIRVLAVLVLVLYPFFWAWTLVGTVWYMRSTDCLPEAGQEICFLIWLIFCYAGLLTLSLVIVTKWLFRRQHRHQLTARGAPEMSEMQLIFDLVRNPQIVDVYNYRGTVRPPDSMSASAVVIQDFQPAYPIHPDFQPAYPAHHTLTPVQEFVASMIQQLPRFHLKIVPSECPSCAICLEDFTVGVEVRLLPCAHNFHVNCIDQWLLRTSKCPQCRCSIFLDLGIGSAGNHSPLQQPPVGGSPLGFGCPLRAALFGSSQMNIGSPLRTALFGSSPYRSFFPSSPLGGHRTPSSIGSMPSIPGSPIQVVPSVHASPRPSAVNGNQGVATIHPRQGSIHATQGTMHRPAHSLPTSHLSITLPGRPSYLSGTMRATGYPISPLQPVVFQQESSMRIRTVFSPNSMARSVPGSPMQASRSPLSPNSDCFSMSGSAPSGICSTGHDERRGSNIEPAAPLTRVAASSRGTSSSSSSDRQRSTSCSPQTIGIPRDMQLRVLVPCDSPLPSPVNGASCSSSPATVQSDCL